MSAGAPAGEASWSGGETVAMSVRWSRSVMDGGREGGREAACHGPRRVTECRRPSLSRRRVSGTRVNTARLSGTSLKSDRSKSRAARASRSQRVQRGPPRAVKYSLATPTRRARLAGRPGVELTAGNIRKSREVSFGHHRHGWTRQEIEFVYILILVESGETE